jgi:hypothetical protein
MNNIFLYIAIDFYHCLLMVVSDVLDGPAVVGLTTALGAVGAISLMLLGPLLSALNLALVAAGGASFKDDCAWFLSKLTPIDSG